MVGRSVLCAEGCVPRRERCTMRRGVYTTGRRGVLCAEGVYHRVYLRVYLGIYLRVYLRVYLGIYPGCTIPTMVYLPYPGIYHPTIPRVHHPTEHYWVHCITMDAVRGDGALGSR